MYRSYSFKYFYQIFAFAILLIIIDQSTKIFIANIMLNNRFQSIEIFPFLNITFVRNTGISFGLFSNGGLFGRYFFSAVSITIGSVLFLIALFSRDRIMQISLLFISGGAIGNAIDRIYFGGVIDFIDFFLYNFHWPAFNLADVFITCGVIILLFESVFWKNKK